MRQCRTKEYFSLLVFRKYGAKGIAYRSSMSETGYNLVLFEESLANQSVDSAKLKEISGVKFVSNDYKSRNERIIETLSKHLI